MGPRRTVLLLPLDLAMVMADGLADEGLPGRRWSSATLEEGGRRVNRKTGSSGGLQVAAVGADRGGDLKSDGPGNGRGSLRLGD